MTKKEFKTEFAQKQLTVEITNLAEQANGSVLARYGDTVVLVTATMAKSARQGGDFFPLTVDYEEKYYASGEILGSRFVRRETRPSEEAILVSRLIDRTIRPLFDQRIRNDVQIMAMVLSLDEDNDPDIPTIIGASLALGISDIPWNGPVSALRIGWDKDDKKFIFNPTYGERETSELNLVVCGKAGKIIMLEAGAKETPKEIILEGISKVIPELEKIENFQKEIIKEIGRGKMKFEFKETSQEIKDFFEKEFSSRLEETLYVPGKSDRGAGIADLKKNWLKSVGEKFGPETSGPSSDFFEEKIDAIVHQNAIEKNKRPDGRKADELRSLYAKAGVLPRAHGSALFFRGETHVLSAVTLGGVADVLIIEGMEIKAKKRFIHHYNFPPFSSGETGRSGAPGRREIGHGALVERALEPVIPPKETFPYTIRVVSETLSSNGSTSMASACASSLALMDAGVPLKTPVAGISMGLMMKDENNYKVLTDIQGPEDHHGDMDFKMTKTKDGLTALQMDIKIEGVTLDILKAAFSQAEKAIEKIFETMKKELSAPRPELSIHAPRIVQHKIDPSKIRDVIGPGGRIIQDITAKTKTEIDVSQDGLIYITGPDQEAVEKALEMVVGYTREFKVGEVVEGKVAKIFDFGAVVEIAPNQDGLVHISEIAPFRIGRVEDVLKLGDTVTVKIIGIGESGRISLSIKALKNEHYGERPKTKIGA